MENGSLISATAGTAGAGGDGGNINIAAPDGFVFAFPGENSDILANAFEGAGGNIDITAIGVFGFTEQSEFSFNELRSNRSNDISATSEFGQAGTVNINALVIDPSQGLDELETDIVNPDDLISNSCLAANSQIEGRFIITGSGGLPHTPEDVTISAYATGDVQALPMTAAEAVGEATTEGWQPGDPIVEPDRVARLADGRIAFRQGC